MSRNIAKIGELKDCVLFLNYKQDWIRSRRTWRDKGVCLHNNQFKGANMEPRCLVCGNPLGDKWFIFTEKDLKKLETCSEKCAEIYFEPDDERREKLISEL